MHRDRNSKGGGVLNANSNELVGYELDVACETKSVCLHNANMPATLRMLFIPQPLTERRATSTWSWPS